MPDVARLPATHWLSREERRALARQGRPRSRRAAATARCLFCFAPVEPGEIVCGPECDDGAWNICPTRDGELFTPA